MADQKRWFKVWPSLLVDMDHLSASDVGHWTRLGCRIAMVGTRGTVAFQHWDHVADFLGITVDDAKAVLQRLPNILIGVEDSDNGAVTVTFLRWLKYQVDSTGAERVKRSRSKKREEDERADEKRGEEQDKEPKTTNPVEVEVLSVLNQLAGTTWEAGEAYGKNLRARIKEGVALDDLLAVVKLKVEQWLGDPKMQKYLTPKTLFRPENFKLYVVESKQPKSARAHDRKRTNAAWKDEPEGEGKI